MGLSMVYKMYLLKYMNMHGIQQTRYMKQEPSLGRFYLTFLSNSRLTFMSFIASIFHKMYLFNPINQMFLTLFPLTPPFDASHFP